MPDVAQRPDGPTTSKDLLAEIVPELQKTRTRGRLTTTSAKKKFGFCWGGYAPLDPPSGPAGAGRAGVITRGGMVDPFWDEKIDF